MEKTEIQVYEQIIQLEMQNASRTFGKDILEENYCNLMCKIFKDYHFIGSRRTNHPPEAC